MHSDEIIWWCSTCTEWFGGPAQRSAAAAAAAIGAAGAGGEEEEEEEEEEEPAAAEPAAAAAGAQPAGGDGSAGSGDAAMLLTMAQHVIGNGCVRLDHGGVLAILTGMPVTPLPLDVARRADGREYRLVPLATLLRYLLTNDSGSAAEVLGEYNALVEGALAEARTLHEEPAAALAKLDEDAALDDAGADVPLVVTVHGGERTDVAAAMVFRVEPPASASPIPCVSVWDVVTAAALRRHHIYSDAHGLVWRALAAGGRGVLRLQLSCEDRPEVVSAHQVAGYRRTDGGQAPASALEVVLTIVERMCAAPPWKATPEAVASAAAYELPGVDQRALASEIRAALAPDPRPPGGRRPLRVHARL